MNLQLEEDVGERKTECPYAEGCSVLARMRENERDEMESSVCTTEQMRNCDEYLFSIERVRT
ncbi:MAG TPA: hypothetical protein ENH99_00210 [Candidatus Pacearchaeota archaeon]|nr:hypothetical protein [Candidatus Pacearchaeota archaeon]